MTAPFHHHALEPVNYEEPVDLNASLGIVISCALVLCTVGGFVLGLGAHHWLGW